jgi:drug/metabolite transporter (DMT)-like permease
VQQVKVIGYSSSIGSIIIWATLPFLIKSGLVHLTVLQFLTARFLIASLILVKYIPSIWRKFGEISKASWLKIFLVSSSIYFLQANVLKTVPASIYVVLHSLTPVLTIFLLGIRLKFFAWVCILLCLISSIVFVVDGKWVAGSVSILTIGAMIGGMICWSYYTLFICELQRVFNDFEIAQIMSITGLFSSLALWLLIDHSIPQKMSFMSIMYPLSLGLIVPVGYYLFSLSLRSTPVFAVTSQYFEPIFSVAFSCLLLKETLTMLQLFAALGCIFFAAMIERISKSNHGKSVEI